MRRSTTALLVLAISLLVSCKSKEVCGPYLSMNLPGVTKIDRCDAEPTSDYGIGGETTATGADFVKAIEASGFELGRDADSTYGFTKDALYFRKGGATYFMFTNLSKRDSGATFFSIAPKPNEPKHWLPEASWQKVFTAQADRKALIERLRGVSEIMKGSAKAPKQCDASLATLDPALAKSATTVLLNLDASDFVGPKAERYARGPETFPKTRDESSINTTFNEKVVTLLEERAAVDVIAERRVMPVIRITDYRAPRVDHGSDPKAVLNFFHSGDAKFDVAVVDLKEGTVLCSTTASAKSSDKLDVTTETRRNGAGEVMGETMYSDEAQDLARNISRAAFIALGKMSPAFAK